MKNKLAALILFFFTILFFISVCSYKQNKPTSRYVCGVPPFRIAQGTLDSSQEMVFNPRYKWKQPTLHVFFTDISDYDLITKTLRVANTWSSYAKIKFVLTTNIFESNIRVSFRGHFGYFSAIGNEAADSRYATSATLWLENLDQQSEAEFNRVVLHEFGHAIGLEHELQNINAKIDWDTAKVYKYYDTAYHWDSNKIKKELFVKLNTGMATRFDPNSIMIYEVPAFLTKNHIAISWPTGLSADDKTNIKKYYP